MFHNTEGFTIKVGEVKDVVFTRDDGTTITHTVRLVTNGSFITGISVDDIYVSQIFEGKEYDGPTFTFESNSLLMRSLKN